MIPKKGVVILVAIAIVLAVVAISLNVLGSDEIPTKYDDAMNPNNGAGKVQIDIQPSEFEDKGVPLE